MPAATTESPTKKQRKKQQRKALAEDSRLVLSSPDALPKPSTHVFTRVFVTAPVDPPIESWTDERLPACFAQFNAKAGHTSLRPVQAWLWANLLSGLDAVAIAPTGSGKTLAYALPLVPHILASTQRGGAWAQFAYMLANHHRKTCRRTRGAHSGAHARAGCANRQGVRAVQAHV